MNIEDAFINNKKWVAEKLNSDSSFFKKLSKKQKPEFLYIGCSDSRATAEEIIGASPGQVFVHRNIANMVVSIDLSVMSVVNYAVDHLKVKDIVVCGHYGCGGIHAAMQPVDMGILNPWLRNIRDVYRLHRTTLDKIQDEDERYKKLVELNVQEQCVNLVKTAAVQKAFKKRGLRVHGWVFDLESGKLIDLKINFDKILKNIQEIYQLI